MLYVFVDPEQIVVFPEIVPGIAGIVLAVTASSWNVEDPHELFAVTVILPLVADAVAVILSVDELPVQPEGRFQV